MGIGGCIALIGVGAVLTFATDWHIKGVNLPLVGIIMMVVGVIGVASIVSIARRRRGAVVEEIVEHDHHHGPIL